MKIIFLYSSMRAGGAERMISGLANYYAQKNIEVSIAVIDDLPSFYPLDPKVELISLGGYNKSCGVWQAVKNNIRLILATRLTFKTLQPDCAVCFGINNLLYGLIARGFLNIKVIGSERNNPNYSGTGYWETMKKIAAPWADGFVFQTTGAKMYYPQSVQKKSEIIPNGIFIDDLSINIVPLSERIPDSICAVGRLHRQKGFDFLIRAFAKFSAANPSYTLTIYGEGIERGKLEDIINDLGLSGRVILAGKITNILEEIAKNKIYVLSSRYEGMPNALIEGMACGCACISTACDFGPSDLIIDGVNGLLVPVDDLDAMVSALQRLALDYALCEKIAKNAVNIRNTHSMEQIAEQYLAYILKTVGE